MSIAWKLLTAVKYKELLEAICATEKELQRFRSLVVNSVMATDIFDKDMKTLRTERWEKAFSGTILEESRKAQINRKATVVIEHLIQAADVAHTMQHWQVYRKWNMRLYEEMYLAFRSGRAETNPSEFWYEGELGFFDHYIIPLANRLKNCGIFGVSGDAFLNYAQSNREEWERTGKDVIAEFVQALNAKD